MYENSIQFGLSTELENQKILNDLKEKKSNLVSKKSDLQNRMCLLHKELENIENKFQTTEEYQIKENKNKLKYLRENTKNLSVFLAKVQEKNDPLELKNLYKFKI